MRYKRQVTKENMQMLHNKHEKMLNFLVINDSNYNNKIPIPPIILQKIKEFIKSNIDKHVEKGSLPYVVSGSFMATTLLEGNHNQNFKYILSFDLEICF